ncbi:MAG TPA: cytochrome c [Candidatus Bathyarchaeia archaeon]|nr:cytochrome c [Candidatus Bathyarchaeia archaeon]
MSNILQLLGIGIAISVGVWSAQEKGQEKAQEKPAGTPVATTTPPAATAAGSTAAAPVKKENPVKSSPEVLAAAKKVFGYDCAMCHGEGGDGKGELVESMSLKMKDWHDPAVLTGMSDSDIYDLIVKGKDKMVGEGDRLAPTKVWGLVHYVRTFAKKSSS